MRGNIVRMLCAEKKPYRSKNFATRLARTGCVVVNVARVALSILGSHIQYAVYGEMRDFQISRSRIKTQL